MGSLKIRHLRLPTSWGFHPKGEFVLLGRTDSTIAGFWAAFIAEVWHQRAGFAPSMSMPLGRPGISALPALCHWSGSIWICHDLSHPFPSRSRNSKSACLPCRTIPSLAQSCRQCQLYQKALTLSTSCLLCSHDMGLNMLAKTQTPNGPSLFPHENAQSQCVIWCDMHVEKNTISRQTHLWISIVLRFVGKAPPFKVFWIILNPKTSII